MKALIFTISTIGCMMFTLISFGQQTDQKSTDARENLNVAKNDVKEAKANLKAAKEDSLAHYPKFKKDTEAKFKNNDKKLVELKSKQLNISEADKASFRNKVELLEQRNTDLKMKFSDFKDNKGREAFNAFKSEFDVEMDRLSGDILDFSINYKK